MENLIQVHVDLEGIPIPVGRLWVRMGKNNPSATFEYDAGWLAHPSRFPLEPALNLGSGAFHTGADQAVFGSLGDSAPDTWGRRLMRRAERVRAKKESRAPRALGEADFLMQVDDRSRQGALRFSLAPEGPFLAEPGTSSIPPLLHLSKLLRAAEHFEKEDGESAEELKLLLAPGSSLGGARPKASIIDKGGALAIAKFPKPGDEYDIVSWEAVAFSLARNAGIEVPEWRLERVAKKPVLVIRRFDRVGAHRIPFLSAMTLLGARDMEQRSYPEIGDVFRMQSANPKADLAALWRRMVFNILISNTDDHLRNHGFLYAGRLGWRLSPAYDMNPVPTDIKPRVHATALDEEDADASLETALGVIKRFGLTLPEAKTIAREVAKAVSRWRKAAEATGLGRAAVERMESAFDHVDLHAGLKL